MSFSNETRYRYCCKVGKHVRVDRAEGQCRDENGCDKPECPLESEFGRSAFERKMHALASGLGYWPAGGGRKYQ